MSKVTLSVGKKEILFSFTPIDHPLEFKAIFKAAKVKWPYAELLYVGSTQDVGSKRLHVFQASGCPIPFEVTEAEMRKQLKK